MDAIELLILAALGIFGAALRARRVDAKAPSSRPLAALAVGLFIGIEVGAIY